MDEPRITKVLKLHILKPADTLTWKELGDILRDTRYRVFRLANLAVSEAYLHFHLWRTGKNDLFERRTVGRLNRELREMLEKEGVSKENLDMVSNTGALPANVTDALAQYKLRAITKTAKWNEIIRGKCSLPIYRLDMAIPVRCDKKDQRRLSRTKDGDIVVELMVRQRPYPKVMLATQRNSLGDGQRAILDRLVDGADGYRQRCFEIKEDKRTRKWHLFVTYDFPVTTSARVSEERVVGVDLGYSCPLYAAVNTGFARLGRRHFVALAGAVRSLQTQTMRRRREIQRGGNVTTGGQSARAGHGRKRKLAPIEKLEGRIDAAYKTLNHQMSAAVIKFAGDNGAGVIQMEKLEGLAAELTGTFLGERWRYEELQRFITYKAAEAGIKIRMIDPRYTSRRCSACGHINEKFTRQFRDTEGEKGRVTRFICPECGYTADPDYNAARNISTIGIEDLIQQQRIKQGLTQNDKEGGKTNSK